MRSSTFAVAALAAILSIAAGAPAKAHLCPCELVCTSEEITRQMARDAGADDQKKTDAKARNQPNQQQTADDRLKSCLKAKCGYETIRGYGPKC
jgi:hypothetical protein